LLESRIIPGGTTVYTENQHEKHMHGCSTYIGPKRMHLMSSAFSIMFAKKRNGTKIMDGVLQTTVSKIYSRMKM